MRRRRRPPRLWGVPLLAAALAAGAATAQVPLPPTGPVAAPVPEAKPRGPIHRAARHIGRTLHEQVIGDPALFHEPPLGYSLRETNAMMIARADQHRFTLYQTDFDADSTQLTPAGAARLDRMARRLGGWLGPILVEATPAHPGLDLQRRDAVLAAMQRSGLPVGPERLVVARSPYTGLNGDDAGISYPILIERDARAVSRYPLPPFPVNNPTSYGGVP